MNAQDPKSGYYVDLRIKFKGVFTCEQLRNEYVAKLERCLKELNDEAEKQKLKCEKNKLHSGDSGSKMIIYMLEKSWEREKNKRQYSDMVDVEGKQQNGKKSTLNSQLSEQGRLKLQNIEAVQRIRELERQLQIFTETKISLEERVEGLQAHNKEIAILHEQESQQRRESEEEKQKLQHQKARSEHGMDQMENTIVNLIQESVHNESIRNILHILNEQLDENLKKFSAKMDSIPSLDGQSSESKPIQGQNVAVILDKKLHVILQMIDEVKRTINIYYFEIDANIGAWDLNQEQKKLVLKIIEDTNKSIRDASIKVVKK